MKYGEWYDFITWNCNRSGVDLSPKKIAEVAYHLCVDSHYAMLTGEAPEMLKSYVHQLFSVDGHDSETWLLRILRGFNGNEITF